MNFDIVARHFRWMERAVFGNAMQLARTTFLSRIPAVRQALLLGEGDGRFLEALLSVHPDVSVDCVDSSRQMLELSKRRVPTGAAVSGKIHFTHADVRSAEWPEFKYDLVVTNFFFDCFNRASIEAIVAKISLATTQSGSWLLADFHTPTQSGTAIFDRVLLRIMYWFFRSMSRLEAKYLILPEPFLEAAGFTCLETNFRRSGFIKSEFWRRGRFPEPSMSSTH